MQIRFWVAGFLLLFFGGRLAGQQPPGFMHFTSADGLPVDCKMFSMTNDKDGFLWGGTVSGLVRFDGHKFVRLNDIWPGNLLPVEQVKMVFVDSRERLWARIGRSGMYCLDLTTLKVRSFNEQFWDWNGDIPSWSVVEVEGQGLWFCANGGLALLESGSDKFTFFPLKIDGKPAQLNDICRGEQGEIWVGSLQGLFRFDTRIRQYERQQLDNLMPGVTRLALDAGGWLWLSLWYRPEDGFLVFDSRQGKVLRTFSQQPGNPAMPANTDAWRILAAGDTIWFALNSGGLCGFDKKRNIFFSYLAELGNPASIRSDQCMGVYRDRAENLWLATSTQVSQIPARRKTVELMAPKDNAARRLAGLPQLSVKALAGGLMAFGAQGGVQLYHPASGQFSNFSLPTYYRTNYNNHVLSFADAGDGQTVWVGTWEGLQRVNKQSGQVLENYVPLRQQKDNPLAPRNQVLTRAINGLHIDRHGILWITNVWGGLFRLKNGADPERLEPLLPNKDPLDDLVLCLFEQDDQTMLFGTENGLVRFSQAEAVFKKVPLRFEGEPDPVSVSDLAPARTGELLAIVNGKPWRIDLKKNTARRINPVVHLENCHDIIEDNIGNVWICTDGQLVQITSDEKRNRLFDSHNSLQDNAFYIGASTSKIVAKDNTGRLYFAGSKGISVIDPREWPFRDEVPQVKITSLKINNASAALDTAIHKKYSLRLPYSQNNLNLEFAVLNTPNPALVRFAYRLNNSEEWVTLGAQNTINFSSLSPGTYRFQVRADHSDGFWSTPPAALHITIFPPWWRSGWAYVIYTCLLLGLFMGMRRYELNRVAAKNEARRLQELDSAKARLYTNITHEFRTPLTVIIGMTEQLAAGSWRQVVSPVEQEDMSKGFSLIHRNSKKLLRLINQMLDLSKLDSGSMKLHLQQADIIHYLRYLTESFYSMAKEKDIRLVFYTEEPELVMDFDEENLQHVVYNLLSNALKFTPKGGRVVLHARRVDRQLYMNVQDNGVGIASENLPRIFDRFYQADDSHTRRGEGTGIGLALTKEFVELMGGSISVSSTPGEGSTFTVVLPVKNEAPTIASIRAEPVAVAPPATEDSQEVLASVDEQHNGRADQRPLLLIVEDNPDVTAYIRTLVQREYQVLTAPDGKAGLETALESVPDIIISDVMMPEMDGYELTHTLKTDERTSHIPIILLTAKSEEQDRIAGLRQGADAYLVKPFNKEELLVRLEKLTELRRRLQERYAELTVPASAGAIPSYPAEDAFLQKLVAIVEARLDDPEFGTPELCKAILLSQPQLHRKLTALTGKSPTLFIRAVRLRKAAELLRTTAMNVSEVAWAIGFNDPNYFSRVFQEEFGKTPKEWRS